MKMDSLLVADWVTMHMIIRVIVI